jgi:hypothetical protein
MADENNFMPGDDSEIPVMNDADDAALDALLVRFGSDYNRPPDIVPREEMWHQIRQKQAPQRFVFRHPAWSALAAAVLLLGVGIGIGMEGRARVLRTPVTVAQPQVAAAAIKSPDTSTRIVAAEPMSLTPARPVAHTQQTRLQQTSETYASNNTRSTATESARSTAYTLATVRHFTAVEALLTSFNTSQHDARGDAQMASWARALLSQTRLLLDSPAAADPARQRLLQDLELVLVQMTQLSPSDKPLDREMIDGSVRQTDMITRLRTAVPAGATHL